MLMVQMLLDSPDLHELDNQLPSHADLSCPAAFAAAISGAHTGHTIEVPLSAGWHVKHLHASNSSQEGSISGPQLAHHNLTSSAQKLHRALVLDMQIGRPADSSSRPKCVTLSTLR